MEETARNARRKRMKKKVKAECPDCGRMVEAKQMWRFNQTRVEMHCVCGRHIAGKWTYRGTPLDMTKEEVLKKWVG
jgi:Zn ribbon nucleic-acid-binding protein